MKKLSLLLLLFVFQYQLKAQTITVTGASNANYNKTYSLCNSCGFSYTPAEQNDAGTDTYFNAPTTGIPFSQYQIYRNNGVWKLANVAMCNGCTSPTITIYSTSTSNTTKPPCSWGSGISLSGDCISSGPSCSVTTNSPITVCVGQNIALQSTATGSTSFTYSWSGPNSFTSTQQNPTITQSTTQAAGIYTITVTGANSCTATATVQVTVNDVPAQPGAFEFSTTIVTPGQQQVYYQVPPVSGAAAVWSYSGNGATISVSNDFYRDIDFSLSATSGVLSVRASNACGLGTARTLNITVQSGSVKSTVILPNILSVPQLTATEISATSSPQKGMLAFDTTNNCLKLYNGTAWVCLATN